MLTWTRSFRRTSGSNLQDVGEVLTDGGHVVRPLEQPKPVELPARFPAGLFDNFSYRKVAGLPLVQNLLALENFGLGHIMLVSIVAGNEGDIILDPGVTRAFGSARVLALT